MADKEKFPKGTKWTLWIPLIIAAITLVGHFYISRYDQPNLLYKEGEYYLSPNGAITSLFIINKGNGTATNIQSEIEFESDIIGYQPREIEIEFNTPRSNVIPNNWAKINISRLVPDKEITLFFTIEKPQKVEFVQYIEHDDGSAKLLNDFFLVDFLIGTFFPLLFLGIFTGYVMTGLIFKRALKEFRVKMKEFDIDIDESGNVKINR